MLPPGTLLEIHMDGELTVSVAVDNLYHIEVISSVPEEVVDSSNEFQDSSIVRRRDEVEEYVELVQILLRGHPDIECGELVDDG